MSTSKKIRQYKILEAPNCGLLTKYVNQRIEKGWRPYGSPYVITFKDDGGIVHRHYQAMVTYNAIGPKP